MAYERDASGRWRTTYPDFDRLKVGDKVAKIDPARYGYSRTITPHLITKKTKTQVTLDNGERYSQRLEEWGYRERRGGARIRVWDKGVEKMIVDDQRARAEAASTGYLNNVKWTGLTHEQRLQVIALVETMVEQGK